MNPDELAIGGPLDAPLVNCLQWRTIRMTVLVDHIRLLPVVSWSKAQVAGQVGEAGVQVSGDQLAG